MDHAGLGYHIFYYRNYRRSFGVWRHCGKCGIDRANSLRYLFDFVSCLARLALGVRAKAPGSLRFYPKGPEDLFGLRVYAKVNAGTFFQMRRFISDRL
jgi:hypothetical protein